jgi:hypothetical protein
MENKGDGLNRFALSHHQRSPEIFPSDHGVSLSTVSDRGWFSLPKSPFVRFCASAPLDSCICRKSTDRNGEQGSGANAIQRGKLKSCV